MFNFSLLFTFDTFKVSSLWEEFSFDFHFPSVCITFPVYVLCLNITCNHFGCMKLLYFFWKRSNGRRRKKTLFTENLKWITFFSSSHSSSFFQYLHHQPSSYNEQNYLSLLFFVFFLSTNFFSFPSLLSSCKHQSHSYANSVLF